MTNSTSLAAAAAATILCKDRRGKEHRVRSSMWDLLLLRLSVAELCHLIPVLAKFIINHFKASLSQY